jgi:hypothetical protein
MLFQISQFSFGSILLFDVPKDLSDVFFEHAIIGEYSLGRILGCSSNSPFNILVVHEIININLDLIEGYIAEVTNNIYYFS